MTCLKRQLSKYDVVAAAELNLSLPKLSSMRERSTGAFFIAFFERFWVEKVTKNR
jgi:hypothetical protein